VDGLSTDMGIFYGIYVARSLVANFSLIFKKSPKVQKNKIVKQIESIFKCV